MTVTVLGSTNDLVEEEVHLEASSHAQPIASTSTVVVRSLFPNKILIN